MKILNAKKYKLKPIKQYEVFVSLDGADDYYISSHGRLIKLVYDQPVIVPQRIDQAGELKVDVKWNHMDSKTEELTASLVAKMFLVNESDYTYVWYKDGNRQNLYCKNIFYVPDHEARTIINNPERIKAISKTQKIKSYFNLNDKKLEQLWRDMNRRCYDQFYVNKHEAYKDSEVCEEWRNDKSKFFEWARENFYEYPRTLEIDKDILSIRTGKRNYSPENCCFVPRRVNSIFRKIIFENESGIKEKVNKNGETLYLVNMTCNRSGIHRFKTLDEAKEAFRRNKIGLLNRALFELTSVGFDGYEVPNNIIDAIREWYHGLESGEIELSSSGLIS